MLLYARASLLFFFLCLSSLLLSQQKRTRDFELEPVPYKTSGSLYRTIRLLDARVDTGNFGTVKAGALNKKEKVVPVVPLRTQVSSLLAAMIDSSAGKGELFLHLRRMKFSELVAGLHEHGYCYLRASLYARNNDRYYEIRFMDTIVFVDAVDVTSRLMSDTKRIFAEFLQSSLLQEPFDSTYYSLKDLKHIDSLEKSRLPLYTAAHYKDGIYNTYRSFANQIPDRPAVVKIKNDSTLRSVMSPGKNGRLQKVDRNSIYAVVCNGLPFIATEYGYYLLVKIKNDFYYEGKLQVSTHTDRVVFAGMSYGLIGSIVEASSEHTDFFEVKIDHLNGGSVPMISATEPE